MGNDRSILSDTDFNFTQLKKARIHSDIYDNIPAGFEKNLNFKGFNQVIKGGHFIWDGADYIVNDGFINPTHHLATGNEYLKDEEDSYSENLVLNKMYYLGVMNELNNGLILNALFSGKRRSVFTKSKAYYLRISINMVWKNDPLLNDKGATLSNLRCFLYTENTDSNLTKVKELPINNVGGTFRINGSYDLFGIGEENRNGLGALGIRFETEGVDPPDLQIKYNDLNYDMEGSCKINFQRIPATSWTTRLNLPTVDPAASNNPLILSLNDLLVNNGYTMYEASVQQFPFDGMYNINCFVQYSIKNVGTGAILNTDVPASLFLIGHGGNQYLIDHSSYLIPDINDIFAPSSLQGSAIIPLGSDNNFSIKIDVLKPSVGVSILGGYVDFHFLGDFGYNYSKLHYGSPELILPPA